MSSSDEGGSVNIASTHDSNKYKGIRRRKWGKWVSEIRVPGTRERLWLGSYATPEAAAVAHDIAFYCLRRPASLDSLNFPLMLPPTVHAVVLSPKSIQKVASDAGMAVDARLTVKQFTDNEHCVREINCLGVNHDSSGITCEENELREDQALNISIEDYL
uniref:AP2/ERF transcription factor n=1 Tax=Camptotheca acuminata TaxID=16922 RepID=A0A7G8AUF8_CAMAC|nr:AP2/ERF transcription factor [Camptotheca acuminata]